MFLRISIPQLKSVLPTPVCCRRSALHIRGRKHQTTFANFPSRPVTTKSSSSKVPPVPNPAVPRKPAPTVKPHSLAPDAAEVRDAQRNRHVQNLAQNGKMMLFQAQSHAGFMFAAWVGGAICFGGALLIVNLRLYEENKELAWFVPVAYRLAAIFLVAIGGWSVVRSSRLISSVEILRGNGKAQLVLNIRRNVPLPFIRTQKMIVPASDVIFHRRMVAHMGRPPYDPSDLKNLRKGFIIGIASRVIAAFYRFFAGVRQFIFSDGLIKLAIQGRGGLWKLDSNGLFLDGGKPLFEVVGFDS
jgi:hypothetical protein